MTRNEDATKKNEIIDRILNSASDIPRSFREEFAGQTILQRFEADSFLVFEKDACAYLPVVIEGELRVYKVAESGREITLYRIVSGESCILTATCILNVSPFPALAQASSDILVLLIPADLFRRWMDLHPFWREYVFSITTRRISDVITTLVEVAFSRIDVRLADFLLRRSGARDNSRIDMTHQQLANELGTAREVISRILKDFERRGCLEISRGGMDIRDRKTLEKISGE